MGSSDRCHGKHSRRIRTWHLGVKGWLARLTNLFEDHIQTEAVHPQGSSSSPNQQVPRPFVQTTSHLPREIDCPKLRQPMPTAPPAFMATSRPADRPSDSRSKPSGQKIDKDKPRWDPIPITYIELFPKMVEIGHIKLVHLASLRPPFPRWYNTHARCDYHARNPGHPTKKLYRNQT